MNLFLSCRLKIVNEAFTRNSLTVYESIVKESWKEFELEWMHELVIKRDSLNKALSVRRLDECHQTIATVITTDASVYCSAGFKFRAMEGLGNVAFLIFYHKYEIRDERRTPTMLNAVYYANTVAP